MDKFKYDLTSSGEGRKLDLPNPLPFEKPFVTIDQGKSFDFLVEPILQSFGEKNILKNGRYAFVQSINTWSDITELDKELENRWSKAGLVFWTETIVTEPAFIEIKKNKTEGCEK